MTKFEIGKTYATRSICDFETIFRFEILARTDKSVKANVSGKTVTRRLRVVDWGNGPVEQFKPFGSYSMCAIINADEGDIVETTLSPGAAVKLAEIADTIADRILTRRLVH